MTVRDNVVCTRQLTVGYSRVPVASAMDIEVGAGEVVALLGRNGAGKTTTLHTLAGILRPISGEVLLSGSVPPRAFYRRVRSGMALVTEKRAVTRRLTVLENLRLCRGSADVAFEYFPELEPLRNRRAGLLSGGEQQMLAIGKLMAQRPKVLLIDELSFGLAPLLVERLLTAVRAASAEGVGVLLVEQQPTTALKVADRGYVLAGGEIRMNGTAAELRSNLEEIERLYLAV
jgi:branched-chain amino acid transport system ATP-binding protein